MNQFTVTAPVAGFNGESCGVVFHDGAAQVNDTSKEGRAAIEYFRRRGYTLTREGAGEDALDVQSPAEQMKGSGQQVPPGAPVGIGDDPFDPSEHDAPEVIAYLDAHDEDADEVARVLEAEQNGKARKTVLQKGAGA